MGIVIIATHMDDEVVGCHGLLPEAEHVVFVTDSSVQWYRVTGPTEEYIRRRKAQARHLAERYGYRVTFLDFGNGYLPQMHADTKAELFAALLPQMPPGGTVAIPSLFDPHPEHNIVAGQALLACQVRGARWVMYSGNWPFPPALAARVERRPVSPQKWADLAVYAEELAALRAIGYRFLESEEYLWSDPG